MPRSTASDRRLTRLARALLALAIAAAIAPAAALGTFPGGEGVIAYSGADTVVEGEFSVYSGHSIWALDPATDTQLQLTTGSDDSWPSFSPSGDMLAFQRGEGKAATVWVAHADGSDATPLVAGEEPAFSADGQQIVFVRPHGLYVTGAIPGSPVRRLTSHPGDSEPQWGSNGEIAFERIDRRHVRYLGPSASFRHGQVKLQVRDELDIIQSPGDPRAAVREVFAYEQPVGLRVSTFPTELRPNWSPDGKRIVVSLCNDLLAPGFSPHLSTKPQLVFRTNCSPDIWAPAGRRLVQVTARPGEGIDPPDEISAGPTSETACPGDIEEMSWQPLSSGTLHVPTIPCQPLSKPRPPESGSAPAEEVEGSRTCITIRHRRRCYKS